ncbi:hypothetical protein [Halodesulfovibrio marinisediminis]|uniref:Uncharacterized protein n=1 Tax=Halodesulfovibrio marinisediminis DSM 17456 TaxID=1121457 RepID=A0A1N6FXK2_9BACT|nr:hypothetical protein [Halodesulfovibrio marinisediminis]SIN99920.1 hypothetical protein SAMN02745161_1566 [Halodesulfovibrio marinisediminis DSM 17456]
MKLVTNCIVAMVLIVCTATVQALAGDVRVERAAAMRSVDMELYTFYMKQSQGLELCNSICPDHAEAFENASGTLAVLLDDAVSSIRSEQYGTVDFRKYDGELYAASKGKFSDSVGCTSCIALVEDVQKYSENGLPAEMARTVLFHTEKYRLSPEQEFSDGLVSITRYQWNASGKKRTCRVSIPKTWGKVASTGARRSVEYRSALGNGIPFFSIQYAPARRVSSEDAVMQELQRRVSLDTLSEHFGTVEILAQGVQRLGNTQSIWVMFSANGKGDNGAGYYYNWYMLVDGTVLMFQSGVSGEGNAPTMEQEELFRKYYQTLREIAVSSVIG